jgi:hypothetical protein
MTTHSHRPDPSSIAPWLAGVDVSDIDTVDPATDPDAADLVAATGITLDHHGERRIPVTVWRVAATDHTSGQDWDGGLSPRVAGLLVGLTTRPGDTIIDFDNDPTLAGAAGAHGVRHVPITHPKQLGRLAAGTASLITLRYPRTNPATGPATLEELFAACARLQTRRGSTVVAIIPPAEGPDYATHATQVIPAAQAAGLGYVEHIIAVTAPTAGERFTNLATPASRPVLHAARASLGHGRYHLDLLVFVLNKSPASSANLADSQREPRGTSARPRYRGSGGWS